MSDQKKALSQAEELRALCSSCAAELEQAAGLRCGLMDSDSRRAEVQKEIQAVLASVVQRLRGAR